MSADVAMLAAPLASDEPQPFRRKLYCTECRSIWESLELPQEYVQQLHQTREELEDARRQLAMLRFLRASEKHENPQVAEPEETEELPLQHIQRRAA